MATNGRVRTDKNIIVMANTDDCIMDGYVVRQPTGELQVFSEPPYYNNELENWGTAIGDTIELDDCDKSMFAGLSFADEPMEVQIVIRKKDAVTGIGLIAEERKRQIEKEGFDAKHDHEHRDNDLAIAGAIYAAPEKARLFVSNGKDGDKQDYYPLLWPFDRKSYKPTPDDRKRELVKAGALIAAEIDRIIDQENFDKWSAEHKEEG